MDFDLNAFLSARRAEVETALASLFANRPEIPPSLTQAMEYSLLAGGKRLRPILTLAGCQAVGGTPAHALPAACALEMIHTYSLIHDDLPSMDNDDFRRGRPTNHRKFGEAIAILSGDALLTEAFHSALLCTAPPHVLVKVIAELAHAAGAAGMVGGQIIDYEATGKPQTLDRLALLHRLKTGALLLASVRIGALLGGAPPDSPPFLALSRYGEALGLAFQIVDDVLDVTADLATLGKDPGSDRDAGKTTFVDLMGIDGALAHARSVMSQGIAALSDLGSAAEPLRALARYTVERDR